VGRVVERLKKAQSIRGKTSGVKGVGQKEKNPRKKQCEKVNLGEKEKAKKKVGLLLSQRKGNRHRYDRRTEKLGKKKKWKRKKQGVQKLR